MVPIGVQGLRERLVKTAPTARLPAALESSRVPVGRLPFFSEAQVLVARAGMLCSLFTASPLGLP